MVAVIVREYPRRDNYFSVLALVVILEIVIKDVVVGGASVATVDNYVATILEGYNVGHSACIVVAVF